jgi:predicted RNase H-like HicB family nuclease
MKRTEPVATTEIAYNVVFEPDHEAGGYVVTCPALPGLVTEGDTLEEARLMAADAIRAYLESLRDDGLPWPPSDVPRDQPLQAPVAVTLETV